VNVLLAQNAHKNEKRTQRSSNETVCRVEKKKSKDRKMARKEWNGVDYSEKVYINVLSGI